MPKARSKDPLLAATTSILLPAVKPFGFQRRTPRSLDRICDDALHTISPWYSGWGGRDFYIPYSVMPLVPPTDFEYVARGTRLRDPVGNAESWPGQTHELADASMQRGVQLCKQRCFPIFLRGWKPPNPSSPIFNKRRRRTTTNISAAPAVWSNFNGWMKPCLN